MFKIRRVTTAIIALASVAAAAPATNEFPLRRSFPDVATISTAALAAAGPTVTVGDVRDSFEVGILHMVGAAHSPGAEPTFSNSLNNLLNKNRQAKVVFYCNGHSCAKSYEAARAAKAQGYEAAAAYDAGILEWATAHPERAMLLGTAPVDPKKIISETDFDKHLLSADEFIKRAQGADSVLIDARDPVQRKKTPDFGSKTPAPFYLERLVPLLRDSTYKQKNKARTLYIFDAAGKQVRWLQYLLESEGYSYYFLKDGVFSVFGEGAVQ